MVNGSHDHPRYILFPDILNAAGRGNALHANWLCIRSLSGFLSGHRREICKNDMSDFLLLDFDSEDPLHHAAARPDSAILCVGDIVFRFSSLRVPYVVVVRGIYWEEAFVDEKRQCGGVV
jgi:hypothetical protein